MGAGQSGGWSLAERMWRGQGAELVQGKGEKTDLGWFLVADNSEVNQAKVTDGALASMKKRK